MKFKKESIESKIERLKEWHDWFAWHPIRIGEHIIWLETVERYGVYESVMYETPYFLWEYREKQK